MRLLKGLLLATALGVGQSGAAQQIGTNATPTQNGAYTLSVKSQLVVETVVVKDKKGNFINGLTAKDFTVTEDGTPQTIRFCDHQELPLTADPLPITPADEEQITLYKRLTHTQIAPEDPGRTQYKNHRLLALYFDMTAMPPQDQVRALAAAEKFVRTQMTPADLISILRYGGGSVDVLQDFTADRNRLLSILQTLVIGEGQGSADSIDDASSADTGAAFGQDDSEFNIFNTDRQLSALQTAAKMLGQMSEKKSLIYFASGLRLNGVDNQAQLHATIDAAIRAGVSFWPIDARGLVAQAPLGDATQGSPGNQGMYSGAAAQAVTDKFQRSQDTMFALAADTGGKALFDNNDLTKGVVQAQRAISDYYIVGYYTTNTAQNGRFRKVKITVDSALEANLEYRQGYYANKEFSHFTPTDKERQLEDALMLGDPITDLTIAMEINYFQLNRAEYFVPIVVKIPGGELALAKRFGAEHTLIDFVCEIKDEVGGVTVTNVRDNVNIKLSDSTAAELARRPIEYDAGFTLTPGRYSVKFLARDDETGRIGTYQTTFIIPNLNKETKRVPISSVVLSNQRVDMKDALYNATKGKEAAKNDAANPLVKDGLKLIPSVTRVFSTDRELYVYLQAYEGNPTSSTIATAANPAPAKPVAPLIAFVSFYRDQKKAFETGPIAVTPQPGSRLGVTPIGFNIRLGELALGRYECQVNVLDPTGQKVAFWQGSIMLIR
ncbi:VWFA-related protein [Edaphobacter aggregans]|uniref:VWFA-related protein n=1 Tax=Edaphobacter aggregans TaxID=570835 RepID=A0A3R9NVJ3_9BACT|nr:VWA domain-containing protein [Edaphobacter aggregans]RSL15622.1 VWFA-related protein [Edaphobacter aggregans]